MSALSRRSDLLDVEVERAVWARGGRPLGGTLVRFGFAGVFLALALAISEPVTRIVFILAGIAAALLLVPVMDRRLEAIGARIARSDRGAASRWLTELGKMRIVALFAPHAWVALQRGRIHLILGNGRAAAKSLADCGRISGHPELPALLSGQAHGLTLAGDRKEAKPLLATLEKKDQLSPRDRLDLGIALLEEPGRSTHAREHLEAAREHLGGHARVLAGLALAHARSDTPGEALPLLEAAQLAEEAESDELAAELIKRARKTLRPAIEAAEKRERKAKASADHAARQAAARELPADARRREKKERRKNKRDKKREAEDKKREADEKRREVEAAAAKQREAEAEAKRRADEEAKRRAEAEAAAAKQREAEAEAKRRAEEEAAAAKRRAEAEAAAAKRRAEEEAAAAKRRAEDEAAAARRREAAAAPVPTFIAPPPPVATPPAKPPVVAPPPVVAAPPVVAPPTITPAQAPAIDTGGWDDLFGDAPAAPPAPAKKD